MKDCCENMFSWDVDGCMIRWITCTYSGSTWGGCTV
jgi:hypothetical protein